MCVKTAFHIRDREYFVLLMYGARHFKTGFNSAIYTYMNTFVCQSLVILPTFFFVRALFGKTASTRTQEARPDTLVGVSARSVHSGARDRRSNCFVPAGADKTTSLVSIRDALVRTYVSVNCRLFSSHQVHKRHTCIH